MEKSAAEDFEVVIVGGQEPEKQDRRASIEEGSDEEDYVDVGISSEDDDWEVV